LTNKELAVINKQEAKHLKTLITQLVQAELDNSWKGSGDPVAIPEIEKKLILKKRRLDEYIELLKG
jgi:hypothetical protein